MRTQRLNVLVYSGSGSTVGSVGHCLYSLRQLLSPHYSVRPVTSDTILKEPWKPSCALLVFPGGGDLGYCRALNGEGNRLIKQYVNTGGAYLGLCAGGYYGSARCEWEVGSHQEVAGDRELAFFPGICRGCVFPGFAYNSEAGASAAEIKVVNSTFASVGEPLTNTFRVYCNGGGAFVDAPRFASDGIEILADYTEKLHVDSGQGAAAVVYRRVGQGNVILTGIHPEFSAVNLRKDAPGADPRVIDALLKDDEKRSFFLKACLRKLGLSVTQEQRPIPQLSRLHLSSSNSSHVERARGALQPKLMEVGRELYLEAEQDTFHIEEPSTAWSMGNLTRALLESQHKDASSTKKKDSKDSPLPDYDQLIKRIAIHPREPPTIHETPFFDHKAYFTHLANSTPTSSPLSLSFSTTIGSPLLYGQVVTSTSTLLEKNPALTTALSPGTTFTATTQLSARGRGSNVWLSPPGALMFSTVLAHPLTLNATAPVVFVQYLAAVAVAEAVQTYDLSGVESGRGARSAYRAMPLRLKWPNDVYIADPSRGDGVSLEDGRAYSKIGGILVNSSYTEGVFTLVLGIGLNVSNAAPTTSLNAVLEHINQTRNIRLEPFTLEKLLAKILGTFSALYGTFCARGFSGELEQLYYKHWLHSGQVVTLETEGGAMARIKGITSDWGLLVAEEVRETGMSGDVVGTGRTFALQSDSNSFDFFKGLLKRKI